MAVIYTTLIIKGKKTFNQVPEKLQAQVKEILADLDVPELAEQEGRGGFQLPRKRR